VVENFVLQGGLAGLVARSTRLLAVFANPLPPVRFNYRLGGYRGRKLSAKAAKAAKDGKE
jgi:hypothetical protein